MEHVQKIYCWFWVVLGNNSPQKNQKYGHGNQPQPQQQPQKGDFNYRYMHLWTIKSLKGKNQFRRNALGT